jgi:FAD/FMN-containing dehydrogenase
MPDPKLKLFRLIEKLHRSLCIPFFPGAVVPPTDPRYLTLVTGFNQRFKGNPKYVQLCGDAKQVLQAVQTAVNNDLRITVRGGGHCYEDFVSCNEGGVIIDLSPMNAVYKEGDLFWVEGGCTLWNVYTQLYKEYDVTLPGGSCYSVGAGGHVVGGGYGLLSRKYGLTIDYLYEIEVVYVTKSKKAKIIRVNRDSTDPNKRDLFWAHLGGGGGNFGIVTRYAFKDLPAAPSEAYLTNFAWNWDDLTEERFTQLVTSYGRFFLEHSGVESPYKDMFTLLHLTHKTKKQIVLTIQYVGKQPQLIEEFIDELEPNKQNIVPQRFPVGYHQLVARTKETRKMPWLEATQTLNSSGANQRGKYKSAYMIRPFSEDQIHTIWQYLTTDKYSKPKDILQALLQVDSYGCEINAVESDKTAIPQRSSIMKLQYQIYWTSPEDCAQHLGWIQDFYKAMYKPTGEPEPDGVVDGCYVNYPDVDLKNWQYLYYKENYPRLQQTKAQWDSLNIFNHKQSIELPTSNNV